MRSVFTHHQPARSVRRARGVIALGALCVLVLVGCGNGGSAATSTVGTVGASQDRSGATSSSAPGVDSSSGAKNGAPAGVPAADRVTGRVEVSKPGAPVATVGPKLTKSASLGLRVKDIDSAAARIRAVAAGLQVQILSEQIGTGGPGDPVPVPLQAQPSSPGVASPGSFGTLTLSVPADKLDVALDQLAGIGTVTQRSMSSQDVTAQYVDTGSRLKTMRASVDRVRALMAQAKDIGQVLAVESELSAREADLESLESQLAALKSSVDRSTLTVSLSTQTNQPATQSGFVAGLHSGWDAFTGSAGGLLTGIGAVLPFVVFLTLVGGPLVWWWRRRSQPSSGSLAGS